MPNSILGTEEALVALPGPQDEGLTVQQKMTTEEVGLSARGSVQRPSVSKHALHTWTDRG